MLTTHDDYGDDDNDDDDVNEDDDHYHDDHHHDHDPSYGDFCHSLQNHP